MDERLQNDEKRIIPVCLLGP